MKIKILYESLFFDLTRCHEETLTLEKATVSNLINLLARRYGRAFQDTVINNTTGTPWPHVTVLVNGHHQGWDAPIADNAEVAFLVPIAGGSL